MRPNGPRAPGNLPALLPSPLTWDKMSTLKETPLLPPEEIDAQQAAAKSLRETASEMQTQLDLLTKREAAILAEMLTP